MDGRKEGRRERGRKDTPILSAAAQRSGAWWPKPLEVGGGWEVGGRPLPSPLEREHREGQGCPGPRGKGRKTEATAERYGLLGTSGRAWGGQGRKGFPASAAPRAPLYL